MNLHNSVTRRGIRVRLAAVRPLVEEACARALLDRAVRHADQDGGGFIKVPVMYAVMQVPFGNATATSGVVVGITAAASVLVYLARGDMHPLVAAPLCLGAVPGAAFGGIIAPRIPVAPLGFLTSGLGLLATAPTLTVLLVTLAHGRIFVLDVEPYDASCAAQWSGCQSGRWKKPIARMR